MKSSFVNYAKFLLRMHQQDVCHFLEMRLQMEALPYLSQILRSIWNVYLIPADGLSGVVAWHKNMGKMDFVNVDK